MTRSVLVYSCFWTIYSMIVFGFSGVVGDGWTGSTIKIGLV